MATQFDTQIQQLYVAYFNRPADASGIAYWADFMTKGGTAAQVSGYFAQSIEYQTAYNQTTSAGVVTAIYQNLFGRSPESTGLAFWVKALNDKAITVDNMVTTIAAGAQGTDKVSYDSKVKVATAFTNALDTDAEKAGYAGDLANAEAKKLLATIKTDAQANAAIVPATLDASVTGVIKAATPFTLEAGLARLDASNKAVVDFLADAEIDLDNDGEADENVTAGNIATNLNNADVAVGTLVGGNYNTTTSATVKAAIVAEAMSASAETLETSQSALTTELGKLTAAQTTALANATAATEAAKDAADAMTEATNALIGAQSILTTRNTIAGEQTITVATNGTVIVTDLGADVNVATDDTVTNVVVKGDDGMLMLATGLKAADYPGVASYITAANAAAAAMRADVDAEDAALLAQARLELSDVGNTTARGTLGTAFIANGPVTPASATAPTADEVAAQLNGLKLLAVDAREKAEAAVGTPAYSDLNAAANTAEGRVETFRTAVDKFNDDNPTAAVTRVIDAEDAVAVNQKAYEKLEAAVTDLTEAQALSTQLEALQKAVATAKTDFTDAKFATPKDISALSNFGTTGNDIFVANKSINAATITSFGLQGDDVLYVGSGYTLNSGKLADGNNSALEVFFTQSGSSTVVTIEKTAFGSSSSAGADAKMTITLTGVDATDLTFENGIISL
jgi:hypothetical protein